MKIAVIGVSVISSQPGGIERYCQELYSRIITRGHEVDLFAQFEGKQLPWFSIFYHKNIKVITLLSFPFKQLNQFFSAALSIIWATFGNYDVIHIYGLKAAWFAWFPQLFSGSKIVVSCQKLDCQTAKSAKLWTRFLAWVEKTAVKNADRITVTSKALRTYWRHKYEIRPDYIPKAPISYGEIDTYFNYGKALGLVKKRYVLYLDRLEPEKRPDLLIKAFKKIQPKGWQLVIAGEITDDKRYVTQLSKMIGSQNNIILNNQIRKYYLAEIVRGAGLLVAPSKGTDGELSATILEAMREGVPVVASDIPVHREIIGTNRGLLFKSEQLNSLVQTLEYVLSEFSELSRIVKRAQTYVAMNHSWDKVTDENLALYLKIVVETGIQASKYRAF